MNESDAGLRASVRGQTVAASSLWNLLGQVIPMVPAVFCIPFLVRGLGVERFGILTLIWVVIGYLGLFDLGLGRSLTKLIAEMTGHKSSEEISRLVWTGLFLLFLLGLLGAVVLASFSPWLAGKMLSISYPLQAETVGSLRLLALGLPAVFLGGGFKGILEAGGRFGLTNAVRIPMGVFSFVGPLIALQFSSRLTTVTAVLVTGRVVTSIALLALCLVATPALRRMPVLDLSLARPLLRLGGWMTVSNVVGPFMVSLDRFMIGMVASTAVVAYYTTPFEVVSKLLVVPGALAAVLFPLFSRHYLASRQRVLDLFCKGVKYILLILFPATLVLVAMAHEGLNVWVGPVFARNSALVLQCLCVGMLLNAQAQIAFALVQGAGKPELTATLHLVELPFYLVGLRLLVGAYGVIGAALAWVMRAVFDTAVLFALVGRLLPEGRRRIWHLAGACTAGCVTLGAAMLLTGTRSRIVFLVAVLGVSAAITWLWVLTPEERDRLARPIQERTRWFAD
jgi:O-antigen/teichoic acid export membrane protein